VSARLLNALPTVLLRTEDWRTPLVGLLNTEAGEGPEAGLLDFWTPADGRASRGLTVPRPHPPGGTPNAIADQTRSNDLPSRHLDMLNLASAVGVRGRRAPFAEQVGEPPIAFLTSWRLAMAADLLRSRRTTIATIAREVGYGTPFALSSAFKREYGVSPNTYRREAAYVADSSARS
jgi:AraC-like DNA-binding protein